ncbi:MAG: glycosyltransferase [Actinomycetota bacterium]|nr:glycosyltransferase [Actinomycetota bacterium]
MRLVVYCDYSYRVQDGMVYAELPFGVFLRELASHCEQLVVTGRLDSSPGRFPYLMTGIEYAPLPHYDSGAQIGSVMRTIPAGIKRFWRALDDVDVAWILGPNPPQALLFALLAKIRGRRLVLGVRQDLPRLIRHRHPDKPLVRCAAVALETAFRLLGRTVPVVVVGPDLARRYRASAELHVAYVSLLSEHHILGPEDNHRVFDGKELRILSVGRLDPEKNPLLLADVLAQALRTDHRWRLDICGDGPLRASLAQRLEDLGVAEHAVLHGHVPIDDGLWDLYRRSHVLLHVSLTEGVPQVLLEAFAVRLPVVATAVGGVPEVVHGRGLLVPPGDADAAARALGELSSNAALRKELVERAVTEVRDHTLEAECAQLASFLAGHGVLS